MRFKSWVNAVLLVLLLVFWLMIFADGLMINWVGLAGTIACSALLMKYSGIWN